jgi:hypothetical protein
MQIRKEQYEQMASEISEASVSVWDNELLACEDGIKLDDLWPILDKYLKVKQDGNS